MLDWFEKNAPIRTKFKALMVVHVALATVGLITTYLAGASPMLLAIAVGGVVATALAVHISGKRVCDPYVTTVVRMEALADGDTQSQIQFTDYKDCVGRMTTAMQTFRDNANEIQESRQTQDEVVNALSNALRNLADNNLDCAITQPFHGPYEELRQNFNAAIKSLAVTIQTVRTTAASVQNGATEIRSASDDLARRNEQQAANHEETAAAMNRVTESVKETATSASEVKQAIHQAHSEATKGGEVVSRATHSMSEIEKSAQEITQIINVIDGIAFQTNLLALNAGVEAARAGDAGRGFAVVANEVRALAQRSADAAKDINKLITASTEQVGAGVTLVSETGELLAGILHQVSEVNDAISGIADAANTQSANLQQVNSSVSDMDRMTQQNAAMVEQSTAATRSLASEAEDMSKLVAGFKLGSEANGAIAFPAQQSAAPATAPAPVAAPAAAVPAQSVGNLALASGGVGGDDDWSEF